MIYSVVTAFRRYDIHAIKGYKYSLLAFLHKELRIDLDLGKIIRHSFVF